MSSQYVNLPLPPTPPASGVQSIDSLTGDLMLSSNDGSIIAAPSGTTIDLKVAPFNRSSVVYQPGGTASGCTYTSWTALYNDIFTLGLAAVDICFDMSFAPIVIPAGTYFLTNVTFQAPIGTAPTNPTTVMLAEGVVFTGFPIVSSLITLQSAAGATTPVFAAPDNYLIFNKDAGSLNAVSGAPLITVAAGHSAYLAVNALSSIGGQPGFPVIDLLGDAILYVFTGEGVSVNSDFVRGGASSTVIYLINNPAISIDSTQTDFAGTSVIQYRANITNMTVGANPGDTVYATTNGQGAVLSGSTSATTAVLTQTGDGVNSAAPVWTTTTGTGSVVLATSPALAGAPSQPDFEASSATSGTITASAAKSGLIITGAGGTTLIIKLPPSPANGQRYSVGSQGAFTTVTWQDSAGTAGNVIGGQAAIGGINRGQSFMYSAAATKWFAVS